MLKTFGFDDVYPLEWVPVLGDGAAPLELKSLILQEPAFGTFKMNTSSKNGAAGNRYKRVPKSDLSLTSIRIMALQTYVHAKMQK